MKKLFPDKGVSRKSLLEFLDKKGFYIVLVLCIAVVGATAVFVTTHNISSQNQDYSAERLVPEESDDNSVVNVEGDAGSKAPIGSAAVTDSSKAAENKTADAAAAAKNADTRVTAQAPAAAAKTEEKAPAKAVAAAPKKTGSAVTASKTVKPQEFILPVMGGVSYAFAQDKLSYSKTLEEWRTHSGIDISADRGTPIKTAADGVVTDIKNDPRYGITIVVEHQNGLKTIYSNLASEDMVNPNQKLKQGDILGCVGNTAAFESAEQAHLHFEVLKNNEPVNPESFLPLKAQAN